MISGYAGRLISSSFAADVLPVVSGINEPPPSVARASTRWSVAREAQLGPASSVRSITDVAVIPLVELLGYRVTQRRESADRGLLELTAHNRSIPVIVAPWSHNLDVVWRESVRTGISADARWCICTNGRMLRIIDTQRTWSRHYLEFDLAVLAHAPETLRVFWTLARAEAMVGSAPLLDRAVDLSTRHGTNICRSLADGVRDAVGIVLRALASGEPRRQARPVAVLLEQSLTVLYRVLFLLFAEARGLVPIWHPIYRDRYTIDSLLAALMTGRRHRGVWHALQAIARLAHAGCRAGDLRVTAFNGRLFSPLHTPSAERRRIDDEEIGRALMVIGTVKGRQGRTRIRYRDLDVEQLGAVYEHLLDYEAVGDTHGISLHRTRDARKVTGSFYTPRSVTGYLVRRTLAPLVRDRPAADILKLRIVDPAMGSGAFLVAACRYLATAVEAALLRDGEWHPDDVTAEARARLRRQVTQQCLFGVDLNPMAVQLARLSLWLATMAGDRPLSFLDHRLSVGDSIAGATLAQVLTRAPGRSRRRPARPPTLFDSDSLSTMVRDVVNTRVRLATEGDDDVEIVRRKELTFAALREQGSALRSWKALLDLWCACWFWGDERPPDTAVFHALSDSLMRGRSALPERVARAWQARANEASEKRRFLHWELEFPEVFFDQHGRRSPAGGFDAVLGNPPWDMVRGDAGDAVAREGRRAEARQLIDFVRRSGVYVADARAHANRYQLFVERALQIARPGGRIGLVLPSGVVSDAGSAPLRRHLFDHAHVDTVVGLDNRAGIFPIHRSVRFVLLTATTAQPTERIACRFGMRDPAELDGIEEGTHASPAFPVSLARAFLERVSGPDDLAMPELASAMDVRIVERISSIHPWLSAPEGWHASFGRELNASDDRDAFVPFAGDPRARRVLEGKQISPFRVALSETTQQLSTAAAFTTRVPRRARLAYRDVASATNRLTLIAAIVPAKAVTTHTLFCLRTPLSHERQLVLCALLNSFVANYLVRLRVNTHVTVSIVSRLPAPMITTDDPLAMRLADLAKDLAEAPAPVETMGAYVELQALAAKAYGLARDEFEHVLGTFPLIPIDVRDAALASFIAL